MFWVQRPHCGVGVFHAKGVGGSSRALGGVQNVCAKNKLLLEYVGECRKLQIFRRSHRLVPTPLYICPSLEHSCGAELAGAASSQMPILAK